jgi:hypothetical protein
MSRRDVTERILERLPETTLAKVMEVKRLLGGRVVSHVGPRPASCPFCAKQSKALKEVHLKEMPVIRIERDKDDDSVRCRRVGTKVIDGVAK